MTPQAFVFLQDFFLVIVLHGCSVVFLLLKNLRQLDPKTLDFRLSILFACDIF